MTLRKQIKSVRAVTLFIAIRLMMMIFRKCVFALVIGALPFISTETHAASEQAAALAKTEERGLKSVGNNRIKKLLTVPQTNGVSFSRSWIDAQPAASGSAQWRCLAEALYFEARGETVKGQFAVAEVIMNRVQSGRFPNSICAVVNQGTGRKYQCQFTYTCDGYAEVIAEPRAYARVGKVARLTMDNESLNLTKGATHYHTTAVRPRWSRIYTRTAKIGVHLFYRHTWRTASN